MKQTLLAIILLANCIINGEISDEECASLVTHNFKLLEHMSNELKIAKINEFKELEDKLSLIIETAKSKALQGDFSKTSNSYLKKALGDKDIRVVCKIGLCYCFHTIHTNTNEIDNILNLEYDEISITQLIVVHKILNTFSQKYGPTFEYRSKLRSYNKS